MTTTGLQDRTRWWSREDVLLLLLLGALLFLPGLGAVPLFDRDEPRFASAARGMLESGDYVVPRFNGHLRPDKPPLEYWAMCLAYQVAGEGTELGARLPSAVFGTLTMVVVYFAAGRRFGRVTGMLSAVILGSCALFVAESRLATADAMMVFFTTLAMACAWRAWDAGGRAGGSPGAPGGDAVFLPRTEYLLDRGGEGGRGGMLNEVPARVPAGPVPPAVALTFWVALALGVLTKGVPLLFVLLPMVVLSIATVEAWAPWRRFGWAARLGHFPEFLLRATVRGNWRWWRGLRPAIGVPLLVLLVGAWVWAAWAATNGELILAMLGQQTDRVRGDGTVRTYRQPPGFYLALVWATFWPWSVLLVPTAFHAIKRMLGRTAIAIDPRPYQFMVVWVVPSWIIYELIVSKLPHYVLPLYIPMAILCADTLVQSWHRLSDVLAARWLGAARWVWTAIWMALGAGVLGFAYWFVGGADGEGGRGVGGHEVFWVSFPLAGALVATGVAGAIAWNRPAWPFVVVLGWGMALVMLNASVLPAIRELRISPQAMADARELGRRGFVAGAAGFEEPSLVFYGGGKLPMKKDPPDEYRDRDTDKVKAKSRQWDALWAGVWNGEPKHAAKEGEAFGAPNVATCLVVDEKELAAIRATGAKVWVYDRLQGFRTDNLDGLREGWGRFWGKPVSPAKPVRVSVVTNMDWLPPAATTQAGAAAATVTATRPRVETQESR